MPRLRRAAIATSDQQEAANIGISSAMTQRPPRARVVLVDDHALLRLGLRHLLAAEPDLEVVADVGTMAEARDVLVALKPDLLLLDLGLGDEFALGGLPRLREDSPQTRILVLSSHAEHLYADRVLRAGAQGYVMKSASSTDLLHAVRQVLAGKISLSAEQQEAMLQRAGIGGKSTRPELSARELEVLRHVAAGKSTAEIAQILNRSVKTIESHKQALKTKLGAETPTQLMRIAIAHFESASESR